MSNKLMSFNFLTIGTERATWLKDFKSDFEGTDYTPVEHAGHVGDLQQGRIDIINSVDTEFFSFCDPDDRVDVAVHLKCVDFLVNNPDFGACFSRELYINENDSVISGLNGAKFSMERFKRSPLEMHNSTVYRTSAVKAILPSLKEIKFQRFEHALKLVLADKYPVRKIADIGYRYRMYAGSQRSLPYSGTGVSSLKTVEYLLEHKLIK